MVVHSWRGVEINKSRDWFIYSASAL